MKSTVESMVEQFRQDHEYFERNIKKLPELISLINTLDNADQSGFTIWDVKGFVALLMFALEK